MIVVDGSRGEGGGQILRSSLALSMATGKPFRIYGIRAGRKRPGLLRQHLASVRAAARVSSAEVAGAELGSTSLSFRPGPIAPGAYAFSVGSAGSSTLVFQTVLPALLAAANPFRFDLEGGTHNPAAPCLEFLDRVYLGSLRRMGVAAELTVERRGFYPAGGGKWSIAIAPSPALGPLRLLERGRLLARKARILWNRIPASSPQRARSHLTDKLGWDPAEIEIEEAVDSPGPGDVILAELRYEGITEILTAFNPFGASPEAVCEGLMADVRRYQAQDVPVGWRLADQLLLPMALGPGGSFRTLPLSPHSRTNIGTIARFLDRPIEVEESGDWAEVRIP